jgi:uncharacterized RDD family membrane protein YckC
VTVAAKRSSNDIAALPVRAVGAVIDGAILAVVSGGLTSLVHPRWVVTIIAATIGCFYFVPQIALWGMTLGARCAGVQVTTNGQPPGWWRSLIRWATAILVSQLLYQVFPAGALSLILLLVVLFLVIYGPAILDPRRRSLNDRAAGTIVLYRYRGQS